MKTTTRQKLTDTSLLNSDEAKSISREKLNQIAACLLPNEGGKKF